MPNPEPNTLKPTTAKDSDQWASNLSSGIDLLPRDAVTAVLLDLALPNSVGVATLDKPFQSRPVLKVPQERQGVAKADSALYDLVPSVSSRRSTDSSPYLTLLSNG
jgi:hypothetical protein